jgi:hypothetical protein
MLDQIQISHTFAKPKCLQQLMWIQWPIPIDNESVLNDATWHSENSDCVLSPQAYLH